MHLSGQLLMPISPRPHQVLSDYLTFCCYAEFNLADAGRRQDAASRRGRTRVDKTASKPIHPIARDHTAGTQPDLATAALHPRPGSAT